MGTAVAERIEVWLSLANVDWHEPLDELIEWARSCGSDLDRAWNECPRADFLMALAGAANAPLEAVVRVSGIASRKAISILPPRFADARKAVVLAERYRADTMPAGADELIDRLSRSLEAVSAPIEPAYRDVEAANHATIEALAHAFRDATMDFIRIHGEDPPADVWRNHLETTSAAIQARRDVAEFGRQIKSFQAMNASAFALRTATECATVAASAWTATSIAHRLASDSTRREFSASRRAELEAVAERAAPRVFSHAACLFNDAAVAIASQRCSGDALWNEIVSAMPRLVLGANPETAAAGPYRLVEHVVERLRLEEHARHADAFRVAVPFSALAPT